MNELNHIPLEEMLMMSFKAFDEGDSILGEKYYKTFEQTKDKALKLGSYFFNNLANFSLTSHCVIFFIIP